LEILRKYAPRSHVVLVDLAVVVYVVVVLTPLVVRLAPCGEAVLGQRTQGGRDLVTWLELSTPLALRILGLEALLRLFVSRETKSDLNVVCTPNVKGHRDTSRVQPHPSCCHL
jgi:hypothetical protein